MTQPDLMQLLRQKCEELSQSRVAVALGYSPSAVNQALKGSYKGDLANLLRRVAEVFGNETVSCPLLGETPLGKCAEYRRRPLAQCTVNPMWGQLWRACQTCPANGKGGKQ